MRETRTFFLDSEHNWIISTHLMCSQVMQGLSANTGRLNSSLQTTVHYCYLYIYIKSNRIPALSFNLDSLMLCCLISLWYIVLSAMNLSYCWSCENQSSATDLEPLAQNDLFWAIFPCISGNLTSALSTINFTGLKQHDWIPCTQMQLK